MFCFHANGRSLVYLCIFIIAVSAASARADVIISEYVEGSSFNKAIEIYNGNATSVDLSTYDIQMYFNGAITPQRTIALSGILAAGEVFILTNSSADPAILAVADQIDPSTTWYNGDDTVVLRDNGNIVDTIGQIGVDPGTQWGTDPVSTADNTLQRKDNFCTGDTNPNDTFDPAIDWNGFAIDTFSGLGIPPTCTGGEPVSVFIHDIQGGGLSSPLVGSNVQIEAIVVANFQNTNQLNGFFVQEEDVDADADATTSEGIFVYTGASPVVLNVGDRVNVTGNVSEFFDLTELTNVTVVTVSAANPLPAITDISLPLQSINDLEAYEGMYVRLPQTLSVTENYNLARYGEFLLSSSGRLMQPTATTLPGTDANNQQAANDLNRILINDASTVQNPDPVIYPDPELSAINTLRSGDTMTNVTGVLNYSFSFYNVNPVQTPAIAASNARSDTAPVINAPLRVAAFNVLNYFNGDGLGGGFPTARGASTLSEFNRQRDKIINAIIALDADIVGLMEIENDGYGATSAIQDLVNGLNNAAPIGTSYAFIDPGVSQIGIDEIAVGLIYREQSVTPAGPAQILDSTVEPSFIDSKNRPVLVQTFDHPISNDRLTVAVNHLKSKGSACDDVADPDTGDGQGNCNVTRTSAATALVNWLVTDPTASGDPDFLIIGDLNAYAMEDPVAAIKSAGYTDLVDNFIGAAQAYTYVFEGQSGYLDHALSSSSLTSQIADVAIWHINSDEPRALDYNEEFKSAGQIVSFYSADAFRSSDHDPVIVGINLTDPNIINQDGTIISNLNASQSNETFIQLSAGTYDVRLINPMLDANAQHYSWSADGVVWSTQFDIVDASGQSLLSGGQVCNSQSTEGCFQETLPTSFDLVIAQDQLVFIKLADTDLSNNAGGLSLSFAVAVAGVTVPFIPAGLMMLFAGLLLAIGYKRVT